MRPASSAQRFLELSMHVSHRTGKPVRHTSHANVLSRSVRRGQMISLATYKIARRVGDDGFDVSVVGSDGARQTILDIKTRADAEARIIQDEQHDRRRGLVAE